METCDRCGKETYILIISIFNIQMICHDCEKLEKEHPDYDKAMTAEISQLKDGNYDFEGIGLPADLG